MFITKCRVLLWRSLKIRKRFWYLTVLEILIPIVLFEVAAVSRSQISGLSKTRISEPTYYDIKDEEALYQQIPIGSMQIWYAPNTTSVRQIIRKVQEKFVIPHPDIMKFESEDKLLEYYNNYKVDDVQTIVAVIFNEQNPKQLNYHLRFYENNLAWNTKRLYSSKFAQDTLDKGSSKYVYTGFVGMQIAINKGFLQRELKRKDVKATISLQQFPDPPRVEDSNMKTFTTRMLPLMTIFSYIFLSFAILQNLVTEISSGLSVLTKMAGMEDWMFWFGWFMHYLIPSLVSIGGLVIFMKVSFGIADYPPIEFCDGGVLFVFLALFVMTNITLCFMISTLFSQSSSAIFACLSISLFSYFLSSTFLNGADWIMWKIKMLFGIFPNVALQYGYNAISSYEMRELGIQWNNIYQSGSESENDVTMFHVLMLFVIQNVLFVLLAIYIDNVNPGKYGSKKPYIFPILFLYEKLFLNRNQNIILKTQQLNPDKGEDKNSKICIEIKGLSKKYQEVVVLNEVDLSLPCNKLILLTGENGAGKTTLLSVISGMIPKTSGTVKLHGKNMLRHNQAKKISVCPQENFLFSYLTVKEHLKFFSILRGRSFEEAEEEADNTLKQLKFFREKDKFANILSEGTKRKLSLGLSLTGNTEILLLDEPNAGIDRNTRLEILKFLRYLKRDKTIIFCTHLPNEVAVFVDYMYVMSKGKIIDKGEPEALKQKYNVGYRLSLSFDSISPVADDAIKIIEDECNLTYFYRNANVIVFKPDNKFHLNNLIHLENKQQEYGISNMEITSTTLEDVVINAEEIDNEKPISIENDKKKALDERLSNFKEPQQNSYLNKYKMLFLKRWYCLKRTYYYYIPGTLIALIYFIIIFFLLRIHTDVQGEAGPPLNLNLNNYEGSVVYFNTSNYNISKYFKEVVDEQNGKLIVVNDVTKSIISRGIENIAFYKKHMILATEFKINAQEELEVNCLYSDFALHSAPISINLAMNSLAKSLLGPEYSIISRNAPLHSNLDSKSSNINYLEAKTVWITIFPLGCFLVMCDSGIFPAFETLNGFVDLQISAGVNFILYWLTNVVFYGWIYLIRSLFILLILVIIDITGFHYFSLKELGALYTIVSVYFITTLPLNYLISYKLSKIRGACQLIFVNIATGFILINFFFMLPSDYQIMTKTFLKILFPSFAFYSLNINFIEKYTQNYNWKHMEYSLKGYHCSNGFNPCCSENGNKTECSKIQSYYWNNETSIYFEFSSMFVSFMLYLLVLSFFTGHDLKSYCIDFMMTVRKCFKQEQQNETHQNDVLSIRNIKKKFKRKQIIDGVSFDVAKSQCYGIMGPNGVGKTAIFKMLSGLLLPDSGKICLQLDTKKIEKTFKRSYRKYVAYCSHDDLCNHVLTVKEHLYTMATLWGHPINVAKTFLTIFNLETHGDVPYYKCSGGLKKRLHIALAFMGLPKVILLDEATNGIDPSNRRRIWNVIDHFKRKHGTAFILSSHNMAECKILCDKITEIKDGKIDNELINQSGFLVRFKLKMHFITSSSQLEEEENPIKKEFLDAKMNYNDLHYNEESVRIVGTLNLNKTFLEYNQCERLSK